MNAVRVIVISVLAAAILAGCGGGSGSSSGVTTATSSSTTTYTIGGSINGLSGTGLVLQDNAGDNLIINTNDPFAFSTPLANGASYDVTVLTQPTAPAQTCRVGSGTGTVSGANVTSVVVNCYSSATPRYAFVANNTDNSVSSYAVDPATGRMKYIGKTAVGTNPTWVAVDPSSTYAYVMNQGANTISEFKIGADGRLTLTGTATQPSGSTPYSMAIDPTGKYAYVANPGSQDITAYAIGAGGALTQISCGNVGAPGCSGITAPTSFAAGGSPWVVTIDSTGKYVYAETGGGTVAQFTIGTGGMLVAMTPASVPAGTASVAMTLDPGGRYAYVANYVGNTISQYTVGAGGALSPMAASSVPAGANPSSITVDPSGTYAYVTNNGGASISQYTIGAGGALIPMATPTVTAGAGAFSVRVDPSGKNAYATNNSDNTVSQYSIGSSGALTPIAPDITVAQAGPENFTFTRGAAVQAVPQFAYVANSPGSVSQYTISGGALSPMAASSVAAGSGPMDIKVGPAGKYVYVANSTSNDVSVYSVGVSGALTQINCLTLPAIGCSSANTANFAAGANPYGIAVDPGGRYVYVANLDVSNTGNDSISQYSVAANGALVPMSPATVSTSGNNPIALALDPSGRYLIVSESGTGRVAVYKIGANGALSSLSTTGGIGSLNTVTVDPSGRYVYVADGAAVVDQFLLSANGTLTAMTPAQASAGNSAWGVAVDPSGRYAYVSNSGGNSVFQYAVGGGGNLSLMTPYSIPAGNTPRGMCIARSGKYVYVVNNKDNNVQQYTAGAGGALSSMGTTATGTSPTAVVTTGTWQ